MAADNVVRIVVTSDNATQPGFDETTAGAEEMAEKVSAAYDQYTAAASEAAEAQGRLDELQADSGASADELVAAQDRVTEATLASIDAQVRLGKAELEQSANAREAAAANDESAAASDDAATKSDIAGDSALGFGSKMKLAALGVGAAIVYGTVKAAAFQSQLETLHTQAGVSQGSLKMLGNGVLALAGQVGADPDSLVEALYHVESSFASVGITGPKALNLLKTAAEGAAVGHASLVDVTNALDATIASGVGGVKNYSQAMGALNAIVGSGDMTMQDLANAMGTGVMAVAKSYGQNIQQVGAALALFGDNNIRGAKAATELRMAWQAMQAPLTTAGPALKSIGLSMTELGHTMSHQGMSVAIQQFVDHLKASRVPMSDWGQLETEIFGKKAGVGIGIMVDQLDRYKSKFPDLEKGAKGFGDAWKAQQKTVSQQWHDLTAGMEALATKMGEVFLPVAMKIVHALTEFGGWLTKNQAAAYALAGIVSGLLAVVIGGKMVNAIKDGASAFKMLGDSETLQAMASKAAAAAQWLFNAAMDANPIMLVVIAIAAIVAAIVLLTMHSKAFRDFWKDAWKDIGKVAAAAWHFIDSDMIKPLEKGIGDLVSWIRSHWQLLATIIATVLLGPVAGLVVFIATHWQQIRHLTSRLIDDVVHFFETLPGRIMHAIADLPGLMLRAGRNIIHYLADGIRDAIGDVTSAMNWIAGEITSHLPFSPAKKGPLSGSGDPEIRGRHISRLLAQGMVSGLPSISAAASQMAGAAGVRGGYGAGAGGTAGQLEIALIYPKTGNQFLDSLFSELRLEVRKRGGGGKYSAQRAFGQVWPTGG